MKKTIRKNIERGVLFGLVCAVALCFARFDARCDELREGVLRLHILANSDSEVDQALKLKVRDRILELAQVRLSEARDVDEAMELTGESIGEITDAAREVVRKEGFGYGVTAAIEENFFENREYDGFTLPAGVYNSLTVRIGQAEGHNWWCVVFPGVCLPAAKKGSLSNAVSKGSANVASNASKYKIGFKTVEIYEKLKKKISKK